MHTFSWACNNRKALIVSLANKEKPTSGNRILMLEGRSCKSQRQGVQGVQENPIYNRSVEHIASALFQGIFGTCLLAYM